MPALECPIQLPRLACFVHGCAQHVLREAAESATETPHHSALSAGEGDLVAIPVALESVPKALSASEDAAEAGEPAGSQVQSGESGSLPQVRRPFIHGAPESCRRGHDALLAPMEHCGDQLKGCCAD